VLCRGPTPPLSWIPEPQVRGHLTYEVGKTFLSMAQLSFKVPRSVMDELESTAEAEEVSVSEVAREWLLDGYGLRTGDPVVLPDGGATLVQRVARIDAHNDYLLLVVLLVLGSIYAQQLLDGLAWQVAMAALAVVALGSLLQWVRQ